MDQLAKLKLAIAGARFGHGDSRLAGRARTLGIDAFDEILSGLGRSDHDRLTAEAEALHARGVAAALLGSDEYPERLSQTRGAPPYLFYLGKQDLMTAPGVGMCGSRNASPEGLRAAAAGGEVASSQGLTVVSGYARGVDMTAHVSALASGGSTVIVLPEGIDAFRIKKGPFAEVWDPERVLVLSQFAPTRPWSAGAAMMRNGVIIGISRALIVVEAGEKGGTLAAGTKALELNRRVITLEFSQTPPGNAVLLQQGALPARSPDELAARLEQVAEDSSGNQLMIL